MGSVSASALIISISFFLSFTMVYSSTMDAQHDFEKALSLRERIDRGFYLSNVTIENVIKKGSSWEVYINNTGKNVLNPYYLTILVNGAPVNSSVKVEIAPGTWAETSVWAPGELLNATISFSGTIERVKVVTQYGSVDYKVV